MAAAGKLLDRAGSRWALRQFGVPPEAVAVVAAGLPLLELSIAAGLLVDPSARYAGAAAAGLLIVLSAGIAWALAHNRAPDCHCFGQFHSEPAGVSSLARNLALSALAVLVAAAGGGPSIPGGVEHLSGAQAESAALSLVTMVASLIALALWGELRRAGAQSGATREATRAPRGLPRGVKAPDFTLTPVRGTARALAELADARRPIVLIYLSTGCGSCEQLLPDIGRWQESLGQTVILIPIFSGDPDSIERAIHPHGLTTALIDDGTSTFDRYRLRGTPSAVLVDADGTIAGAAAEGVDGVEALIRSALDRAGRRPARTRGVVAPWGRRQEQPAAK